MIYIGLTGWGDHQTLYPSGTAVSDRLKVYSSHFPIVEVDSSFYAIQSTKNYDKWVTDTPESFRFVIKAFQGLTGHDRSHESIVNKKEIFQAFRDSIQPVIDSGKLKAVLFQYPPWFDCKRENVEQLRYTKEQMEGLPVALEFRNQTWFYPEYQEKTLAFMQREEWIHSICDEPQAGIGSIPTILHATHPELTLIRFHGRNVHGWNQTGQANWREVRFLYRYNKTELLEWKKHISQLENQTKDICILFNNNSGGDAADNAKQLIQLLGIEYKGLAPRQLELFE